MKAKDLRIGNYVYDDYKEVHKVEQVSSKDCKDWNKQPEVILSKINGLKGFYQSNDVFPIPLTEEWLLKMGFLQDKVSYKIDNENFVFELYFYDAWNLNYVEKSNFGNGNVELSGYWTIHQLQNLYFALTGEELTLTETPCPEKE